VGAADRPTTFRVLADAYEQAFEVRIARETREVPVLLLTAGDDWAKNGFRASDKKQWAWSGGMGVRPGGIRFEEHEFEGVDMDHLADWLEEKGGKVVLNEIGIKGRFDGAFEFTE